MFLPQVRGSLARKALIELAEKNLIKLVSNSDDH
jgi:ribosomal protein S25